MDDLKELSPAVRSSKLDDVLEVDDVFHSVLLHDLALPEEVLLVFLHRKRSLNQAAILLIKFEFN